MSSLGLVAVGAGLSQVLLSLAVLMAGGLGTMSRRLYGVLMVSVLGYLLIPLAGDLEGGWLLGAISTLVPGAFWLFCASLFDDHYQFPPWQPALVAVSVLTPSIWRFFDDGTAFDWLFIGLPQVLEFVFLGLALWAIFNHWRDDLVAARRSLRFWFCGISGVFIFTLILSREVLFAGEPWLENAQYLATAIVLVGSNILLLRFTGNILDPVRKRRPAEPSTGPEPGSVEDLQAQLEPVNRLVLEEGIHREHGMTIGKLAEAAGLPEYRLRNLINSGLGFRNFNDFLNSFRIAEASRRLADPEEARIPVLTIALDVGFRSISSFNKSFKDTHQLTPTAYRKQQLGG